MRVCAIIAEYNPFHKGHLYQIERTRENGADCIVAVMSGNYVQRCESALLSKHVRAETALKNGVDLVLELPLPWATASAEKFAAGSIDIINALAVVDALSFGSECGDTELLKQVAELVLELDGSDEIKKSLARGMSFPKARENALRDIADSAALDVLRSPNDILGVEYIKALIKTNSRVLPMAIRRVGAGHDSRGEHGGYMSASEIRARVKLLPQGYMAKNIGQFPGLWDALGAFLPAASMDILERETINKSAPSDFSLLETAMLADLRKRDKDYFLRLPDVNEGLENRVFEAVRCAVSLEGLYIGIKTKRYTLSRIRRIILSAYLEIFSSYSESPPPYIRVLGFNERGKEILGAVKGKATLPVVTRAGDIARIGGRAAEIFALEARATALYNLTLPAKRRGDTEYTDGVIQMQNSEIN